MLSTRLNWLHRWLFYVLVLLIPVQLGKHFWPDFAFVQGIRLDYLSPTLYLTDLVLGAMLLVWAVNSLYKKFSWDDTAFIFLMLAGIYAEANIYYSLSPYAAIWRWAKYLEMGLLILYVARVKLDAKNISKLLVIGGLFTVLLALLQLTSGGSVGGWWYYLGERSFTLSTPGIAKQLLFGREILRPYATFAHPNVLAGFFVATLPFIWNAQWVHARLKLFLVGIWLAIIYLSGSAAALAMSLAILAYYVLRSQTARGLKLLVLGLIIFMVGILPLVYSTESITRRVELNSIAYEIFKSSPIVGIGMNNFVVQMSNYPNINEPGFFFQPAHNIYLLLLSEGGIIGVGLLAWLIWKIYMIGLKRGVYIIPLVAILVLGLFDHYPLTLQQGQLLLALVIGLNLRSTTGG